MQNSTKTSVDEELQNNIISILSNPQFSSITARRLAFLLDVDGQRVNKILYRIEKNSIVSRDTSTPPAWKLSVSSNENNLPVQSKESSPMMYVFIDVDNSPCLKEACYYASPNVKIYAYASSAYNNYRPASNQKDVTFYQLKADEDGRDAADARFCMSMTCIAITEEEDKSVAGSQFIVVSKDKTLHTYARVHHQIYGILYQIVTNSWEGLREILE